MELMLTRLCSVPIFRKGLKAGRRGMVKSGVEEGPSTSWRRSLDHPHRSLSRRYPTVRMMTANDGQSVLTSDRMVKFKERRLHHTIHNPTCVEETSNDKVRTQVPLAKSVSPI